MQSKLSHGSIVVILRYIKNCLCKVSVASPSYLYCLESTENYHIDVVSTDTAFRQTTCQMVKRLKFGLFHEHTHTHTHTHTEKRKTNERKFYTQVREESIQSFCRKCL